MRIFARHQDAFVGENLAADGGFDLIGLMQPRRAEVLAAA